MIVLQCKANCGKGSPEEQPSRPPFVAFDDASHYVKDHALLLQGREGRMSVRDTASEQKQSQ